MSTLTHLDCSYCGKEYDADVLQTLCPECGKPLFACYDLEGTKKKWPRESLKDRETTLWRYREILPVKDKANAVTLGEGYTPLFPAKRLGKELGMSNLFIKDEGLNPTGSFKARGLCMAIS
ncbi:pyridoxal-phosphate dependent enzyme, partial [Candidatus Bipolaricaulota bacterium]|nr:pyridoxal-phosphate dependent enzyme [Candidatus Bipolaricaulota bacterium]